MPGDQHANFAVSTVATAPSPASSGTSLVVASGEGSRFSHYPFNAVISPVGALATPANAEVVRVTNRSSDTLTITRTQEASSARTVQVGDRIYAGPTKKTLTDVELVYNVKAYGATGDGVTDDTAAIQAAIDAAGSGWATTRGNICYLPSGTYMFSNLTLWGYMKFRGAHMGMTGLKRITGSTGTAIREKTSGEGNTFGATNLWLEDFRVDGNGTTGDGLHIGVQNQLNGRASMQSIFAYNFPSGYGIWLDANAINARYLWSDNNDTGIYVKGGGNQYFGLFAEFNTTNDILVHGSNDTFHGIQIEHTATSNDLLRIETSNNTFFGVYFGITGNCTNLINLVSGQGNTDIHGVHVSAGASTWTDTIHSEATSNANTGMMALVPEWHYGGGTSSGAFWCHSPTGQTVQIAAGVVKIGGNQIIGTRAAANADTSSATLPQLEIEVNQLKAMLRTHGLMAP